MRPPPFGSLIMLRKCLAWAVLLGAALSFIGFIALLIYAAPIILIGLIVAILTVVALVATLIGLTWALHELGAL